jgi:hypothetical protein
MVIQRLTLSELREKVHRNKKYKNLLETFQTSKLYNIPLESYKEEVLTLHSARSVRTLNKFREDDSAGLVDGVIKAHLIDQGQRSRLTEILIQCTRASAALSEALRVFKDYSVVHYDPYLNKIKTKGERTHFLDTCLSDMYTYITDCELTINLCRLVIADIDAAGWSLTRTINALGLSHAPERRI